MSNSKEEFSIEIFNNVLSKSLDTEELTSERLTMTQSSAAVVSTDQQSSPSSNEDLLLAYLGPKHLPYESLIPITFVYSLIFTSGIIGNFSTCLVIIKAHYMRTSTNYYLFNLGWKSLKHYFLHPFFYAFFHGKVFSSCTYSNRNHFN